MNTAKPNNTTPDYVLRLSTKEDDSFIYSSWARGHKESEAASFIPKQLYTPNQNDHIANCLNKFTTYMLCHPDDTNELFGFITFSFYNDIMMLHWLYIKSDWRKHGIASSLIEKLYPNHADKPIVLTQYSKFFPDIKDKFNLIYDPYFIKGH